ncbi:unnamed protein product [Sphagnum jensenii]|uniref:Uncharacterized protein n=1 Tax=Sphagnum jensenii TaxID=128206 RepID=A0ABP1A8T5_9BRYO
MGQMQRRWHRFAVVSMLFLLCLCPIPSFSSNEETRYVVEDSKGNATFSCDASGPCIPCSYSEKQTDEYHCKQTGFHQPLKCVEMKTDHNAGQTKRDSQLPSEANDVEKDGVEGLHQRRKLQAVDSTAAQKLLDSENFKIEGGLKVYHIYKFCSPQEQEDKLSVWQFEALVIGSLALCSPLLYYRRKHSFLASGMTRIPNNPRF